MSVTPPYRPATFADTLLSEWAKLRTLRSTAYTLLAAVILGVGFGVLYAAGAAENYQELRPEQQAGFDPTFVSLFGGTAFSQLAIGVLGVLVITSEYATGMIGPSLTAVPRRGRWLLAKVMVFAAVAVAAGIVVGLGAFLMGQPNLAAADAPRAALGQSHVLRAVLMTGPYLALVGLFGMAVGFLVRATAGGITIVVAATALVPNILLQVVGGVADLWPTLAGLRITTTIDDPGDLSPWAGFGLFTAFVAAMLTLAYAVFRRTDA
ncbi:ABC transporter permease [Microbispora sp. NPDC049125]|uniref:ABC transporter permease n=1 Tax=Microbispora sp. NPDC049125 TaxID=3154929 RepID=UPI0034651EBE